MPSLLLVDFYRITVPEGRIACQKLIYQNAQSPPVDGSRVPFRLDNFGGQVLRRPTQSVGLPCVGIVNDYSFPDCFLPPVFLPPQAAFQGFEAELDLTVTEPLGKAKIHQLYMAFCIEQQVLGLEIAVGNAFALVQEFEDQDYLRGVEARGLLVESLCLAEIGEYFAARAVFELWFAS